MRSSAFLIVTGLYPVRAACVVFLPHGGKRGSSEDGGLYIRRGGGPFGQVKVSEDEPIESVLARVPYDEMGRLAAQK